MRAQAINIAGQPTTSQTLELSGFTHPRIYRARRCLICMMLANAYRLFQSDFPSSSAHGSLFVKESASGVAVAWIERGDDITRAL